MSIPFSFPIENHFVDFSNQIFSAWFSIYRLWRRLSLIHTALAIAFLVGAKLSFVEVQRSPALCNCPDWPWPLFQYHRLFSRRLYCIYGPADHRRDHGAAPESLSEQTEKSAHKHDWSNVHRWNMSTSQQLLYSSNFCAVWEVAQIFCVCLISSCLSLHSSLRQISQ